MFYLYRQLNGDIEQLKARLDDQKEEHEAEALNLKSIIQKAIEENKQFQEERNELIEKNNLLMIASKNSQVKGETGNGTNPNKQSSSSEGTHSKNEYNEEEKYSEEYIDKNNNENDINEEVPEMHNESNNSFSREKVKEDENSYKNLKETEKPIDDNEEKDSDKAKNKAEGYKVLGALEPNSGSNQNDYPSEGSQNNEEYDVEDYKSRNGSQNSNLDSNNSDPKYSFPMVHAVEKYEIIPTVTKVLEICIENNIDIMDVQNILFADFDINNKVSIVELKNQFIDTFQFESNEATLLSRYLIEIPEKNNADDNKNNEFRFDPDRQLSQAKVVSRLQAIMSIILDED